MFLDFFSGMVQEIEIRRGTIDCFSSNFIDTYHFDAVIAKTPPINIGNWQFFSKCSFSSQVYRYLHNMKKSYSRAASVNINIVWSTICQGVQ
jgi:hypothetical protein